MNKNMAFEWLKSASDDLKLIEEIIHNDYFTHMVAFHSQQSVEKSLKALLEYNNRKIPKKHDLILLKSQVSDLLEIVEDDILDSLNRLYIETRYPGDLGLLPNGKPDIEDAKVFYEFAKSIYKKVESILS